MSENNTRTDGENNTGAEFTETENLYQSKREQKTEIIDSTEELSSGTEVLTPKFSRTPAPESSTASENKYARTPAPAAASIQTPAPQPEEKKKLSAALVISRVVLVIFLLAFAATAGLFINDYYHMRKCKLEAQRLSSLVSTPEQETDDVGLDGILEKYRELYNQNHDLVGWITVPNTKIDHPVVQAADNDFYLRKNFSKGYERRGSIFMDFRCNKKDYVKNTILYGHNYLDSTMFSDLENYKDLEFYKSAPVIEFNSIYKNQKWKVFGVYLSNVDEKDDNGYAMYYIHPFMTDDNFEAYVQTVRERSIINAPVDIQRTDKILTLSTCTRDMDMKGRGQTNARCVIVARLIRDGEKEDVNVAAATYNENPRYPQIWYTVRGLENPYLNASRWYPEGDG